MLKCFSIGNKNKICPLKSAKLLLYKFNSIILKFNYTHDDKMP